MTILFLLESARYRVDTNTYAYRRKKEVHDNPPPDFGPELSMCEGIGADTEDSPQKAHHNVQKKEHDLLLFLRFRHELFEIPLAAS